MIPIYAWPRQKSDVLARLAHRPTEDRATQQAVRTIIDGVRDGGDAAVVEYTARFDGVTLLPHQLRLSHRALEDAWDSLPGKLQRALRLAKRRIEAFHRRQRRPSWEMRDAAGFRLGQRWMPIRSAGLYVPGGAAAYPSSLLMNAIPAQVAGVERIVAVTPPAKAGINSTATLGALHLLGVKEVYQVGGAQAVAALAFGTESIPRVDKVVGPGNRFVAEAKRLLYGTISIDMVAGPSEVLIVADETAPIEWIAADMLAQAEHDPVAQAVAIFVGRKDGKALADEVRRQVESAPRRAILEQSLPALGMVVHVPNMETALKLVEEKAPEHLQVMTKDARAFAAKVRNAGSIFVGAYAAEAIGDYIAGPNHVLPTGGTARFFSPLSVQDFLKMSQVIECSAKGIKAVGAAAADLADAEGLDAHAQSIRRRMKKG